MDKRITEVLQKAVENGDVAGANVLVLQEGKEAAYCQYGYRDMENRTPVSRDTIFRLYSQTKPVTAAAAVLLASEGRIDLGAELSDYLPEYKNMFVNRDGVRMPAKRQILVRDLLNMTAGLAYPDENTAGGRQSESVFREIGERLYSGNPVTTAEFSVMMSKTDLCFEPGERFMYGTSADVLGALIEKVSGMPFRDFLFKHFFEPLEMEDTDFYVPSDKAVRLAKVYDYSDNGLAELRTNHLGLRYERNEIPAFQSGGAGLCSTLDDYARFGQMLLSGGTFAGCRILPEYAVRFLTRGGLTEAQMPQLEEGWSWMRGYTYGNLMRVCRDESRTTLFSTRGEYGWDGWLGTFFSNEPAHGITLLFGTQQVGVGKAGTLVRKIKNVVMSELV